MRKKTSLSPTEERNLRKKKLQEEEEKLDVIGQESDSKAKKWVIEVEKEKEKERKKKEEDALYQLDQKRKSEFSYKGIIMRGIHDAVARISMPQTYEWGVWFDGKGIILAIKDKTGQRHVRAFKVTFDPKYDLNAAREFVVWAEDIYDKCENKLEPSLWTPTN